MGLCFFQAENANSDKSVPADARSCRKKKKNHQKKKNKEGKPESFLLMIWQRRKHTIFLSNPKIHCHCAYILPAMNLFMWGQS